MPGEIIPLSVYKITASNMGIELIFNIVSEDKHELNDDIIQLARNELNRRFSHKLTTMIRIEQIGRDF